MVDIYKAHATSKKEFDKAKLRFRKSALKRFFIHPFIFSFKKLLQIPPNKALKQGLIHVSYITPKSEIDDYTKTLNRIELQVRIPKFLLKSEVRNAGLLEFKQLVQALLNDNQNRWYDIRVNIEFLSKDLILHWVSEKGRGISLVTESLQGLTKDELDKIVSINFIQGISDQDRESKHRELQRIVYVFVMRKCPWILNFTYPPEYGDEWIVPFASYFKSDAPYNSADWLYDFNRIVEDELRGYENWINTDPKELKHAYKHNRHWIKRFKLARDIKRKYPTFERDLKNLHEYLQTLFKKTSTSPLNLQNYPLNVSLYFVSREFGGHEEGGWHYDWWTYKDSIKVNNYKEARSAVVRLLKNLEVGNYRREWEGIQIILEKEPGGQATKERPHYS